MRAIRIKHAPFDADECLERLSSFRGEHGNFIDENTELDVDIDALERTLKDARYDHSDLSFTACREAFGKVLSRLEEIAEDHQRLYDESPLKQDEEVLYQSTQDFEVKRDLEKHLCALL